MNYKEELTEACKSYKEFYDSKLDFICEHVFSITTYESEMAEIISQRMLDVCEVILNGNTYQYIEDNDNRINYLIMVNMPFLKDKIEWGISIRGAWFDDYDSTNKDVCIGDFRLIPRKDLKVFIKDLIEWSREEN